MGQQLNINTLKKQNTLLKILIICMLIFIIVLAFADQMIRVKNFKEITVRELSLIDSTGTKRMIMTTDLSKAPWGGKELKRNVPPNMAGIIYLDPNGDEVGGTAFGGNNKVKAALNTMDYTVMPLEAIGYSRYQTEKSTGAHFIVMDNPRENANFNSQKFIEEINTNKQDGEQLKILREQMVTRVILGVDNHNANLVLKDNKGNNRIVLEVNDKSEAVFKILDENGNIVQKFPE